MRIAAFALMIAVSISSLFAQDRATVVYTGGTVPNLKPETAGRLDITEPAAVAFVYPSGKLAIDFDAIQSYEYSREVAHHLGILPAIEVGLVKARKQNHLLRITYRDANNASQVAVFRIPKQMPHTLLPVLRIRAPQAEHPCGPGGYPMCLQK